VSTLGEKIVEHLTTKGASLDDGELAEALGVGRTAIAETCRQLEAQGLVVRNMAGGTRSLVPALAPRPATPAPAAAVATAAPRRPAPASEQQTFPAHARRILSTRWGTILQRRDAMLAGGVTQTFELVSGNGRIVGDVVWLADRGPRDAKSAAIAEAVLLVGHAANAHRRFLVFGEERDVVTHWLSRYRGCLDDVEVWFLAGDKLERLA
jgi:biotin operon repressor